MQNDPSIAGFGSGDGSLALARRLRLTRRADGQSQRSLSVGEG
jgi:hypothetical protein